ncbi:MAG: endonuclease [Bacteroidaceae bacterium]|nr:endonuclease [Bacteroidaceae bacterium]
MKHHYTLFLLSLLVPYLALAGIPNGYYTNADGKKKAALKAAMYSIISPHTKLGYSNLWAAYEKVDYLPATNSQGRHQVMDYYSDEVYYFTGNGSAVSGMNKEHVAPQSWWGKGTSIAVGNDLFQVIPSDERANNAKGNYPLGEVTGTVSYSNPRMKTGRDANGDLVFEPCNEYKGDFARIFFYVATCYPDVNWQNRSDVNVSFRKEDYPTLKEDILPMLLRWSKNDPVCEWEITRNERAYGEQGNRNPFIDFPNLAEYIWGDSIDYAFSIDGTSGSGGQDDPTPQFAVLVDCSMKSGLDPFFVRTSEGCEGEVWTSNSSYGAVANAYSIAGKTADEYLMLSLDLSMMEGAVLSFQHATGYNKTVPVEDTYFQVLVSYDYESVPEDATWRKLDANFPALQSSSNFTQFVSSGDISLAGCCGRDNVTLAFRYISNSSACYCWEIRDVKVTAYELPDALPLLAEEDSSPEQVITYDLMGRQVPHNTKGLVIRNGKKILQR